MGVCRHSRDLVPQSDEQQWPLRPDCPLLALGLVLDGSGFVRRSQVFAGNLVQASTLAKSAARAVSK